MGITKFYLYFIEGHAFLSQQEEGGSLRDLLQPFLLEGTVEVFDKPVSALLGPKVQRLAKFKGETQEESTERRPIDDLFPANISSFTSSVYPALASHGLYRARGKVEWLFLGRPFEGDLGFVSFCSESWEEVQAKHVEFSRRFRYLRDQIAAFVPPPRSGPLLVNPENILQVTAGGPQPRPFSFQFEAAPALWRDKQDLLQVYPSLGEFRASLSAEHVSVLLREQQRLDTLEAERPARKARAARYQEAQRRKVQRIHDRIAQVVREEEQRRKNDLDTDLDETSNSTTLSDDALEISRLSPEVISEALSEL